MVDPKVLIGVPTYGNLYPPAIWNLLQMVGRSMRVLRDLKMITGSYVHEARNVIAKQVADDPECTHLMFVDQDHTMAADTLVRLLERNVPVVGAWYCDRSDPPRVTAFDWSPAFHRITDHRISGLQQVGGVPLGMTLIRADVLRHMRDAYGDEQWFQVTATQGEDVFFCSRLKELGIPVYLDNDVRVGHLALVPITYEHWLAGQKSLAAS